MHGLDGQHNIKVYDKLPHQTVTSGVNHSLLLTVSLSSAINAYL